VLYVALIMLILLALLGIAGMQVAGMQERWRRTTGGQPRFPEFGRRGAGGRTLGGKIANPKA
jgi:hypothetical protein